MGIVIDICLVAVMAVVVYISAKKGIIAAVAELLAFVVAIFFAIQTAKPVASGMYKAFFYKTVQENLYKAIPEGKTNFTAHEKAQLVLDNMPDFAKIQTEKLGINASELTKEITKIKNTDGELYEVLEEKVVRPIAVDVLQNITFFFLCVIYGLVLRFVFLAIAKYIHNSKTLGSLDKFVGGVLGAAKGVLIVFVLCLLLNYFTPRVNNANLKQGLNDSKIIQISKSLNPIQEISLEEAFKG